MSDSERIGKKKKDDDIEIIEDEEHVLIEK